MYIYIILSYAYICMCIIQNLLIISVILKGCSAAIPTLAKAQEKHDRFLSIKHAGEWGFGPLATSTMGRKTKINKIHTTSLFWGRNLLGFLFFACCSSGAAPSFQNCFPRSVWKFWHQVEDASYIKIHQLTVQTSPDPLLHVHFLDAYPRRAPDQTTGKLPHPKASLRHQSQTNSSTNSPRLNLDSVDF